MRRFRFLTRRRFASFICRGWRKWTQELRTKFQKLFRYY